MLGTIEKTKERSATNAVEVYSAITHLAWAHFLSGDSPQRLMMFGAGFFDKSGSSKDIALAVGGYAASRDRWNTLDEGWSGLLSPLGIEYFRMSEFLNFGGQFADWRNRRDEMRSLFDQLSILIENCVQHAFGCVILLNDYNTVNAEYMLSERFGHPFPLAGLETMKRLHMWANARREMPILSVFEDGDEHKGELIDLARKDLPQELRPVFQPKRLTPLQAADIAAWDLRNVTVMIEGGAPFEIWQKSLDRIQHIPDDYAIYSLKDLLALCRDANVPKRTARGN